MAASRINPGGIRLVRLGARLRRFHLACFNPPSNPSISNNRHAKTGVRPLCRPNSGWVLQPAAIHPGGIRLACLGARVCHFHLTYMSGCQLNSLISSRSWPELAGVGLPERQLHVNIAASCDKSGRNPASATRSQSEALSPDTCHDAS